jgi:hypothetical protein
MSNGNRPRGRTQVSEQDERGLEMKRPRLVLLLAAALSVALGGCDEGRAQRLGKCSGKMKGYPWLLRGQMGRCSWSLVI